MVGSETCGDCLLTSSRKLRVCSFHEGILRGREYKKEMDYYASLVVLHCWGWGGG